MSSDPRNINQLPAEGYTTREQVRSMSPDAMVLVNAHRYGALLDVVEAARLVDAVVGPLEITHQVFQYDCLDRLHIALSSLKVAGDE
jgi:hypothetical protein